MFDRNNLYIPYSGITTFADKTRQILILYQDTFCCQKESLFTMPIFRENVTLYFVISDVPAKKNSSKYMTLPLRRCQLTVALLKVKITVKVRQIWPKIKKIKACEEIYRKRSKYRKMLRLVSKYQQHQLDEKWQVCSCT